MSEQPQSRPPDHSLLKRRRAALGYDGRSERRALRGAARRRKLRLRLWLVTAPVVAIIALIVVLLVVYGGSDGKAKTPAVSTTVAQSVAEGELLVVREDNTTQAVVIFQSHDADGFVLVVPGITLLRDGDSFRTLSEIHGSSGDSALATVLDKVFGAHLGIIASISFTALETALTAAGATDLPATLQTQAGAEQLAAAFQTVIGGAASAKTGGIWQNAGLEGDSSNFTAALQKAASTDTRWTSLAVGGTVVQGEGFTDMEPQVATAKALLSGTARDADVTVQIRNGSGQVGAVEGAAAQLQPLGYQVAPAGNSDDFPNAAQTRIVFATDDSTAAARVQALLGVGVTSEDPTLDLDTIVVVLGADYVPPMQTTDSTG